MNPLLLKKVSSRQATSRVLPMCFFSPWNKSEYIDPDEETMKVMEEKRAKDQEQGATAKQDILPHGHRVVCENRIEQHEGKSRQDVPFSKTKPDKHREAPAEHKGGRGHLKEKKDAYRQIDAAKEPPPRSLKDYPNKEGVENRMVVRQPVVTMPRAPLGNAQDLVDDVV